MNLIERVKSIDRGVEVITDWLGDGGAVVDQAVAQRRADICMSCPMNRDGSKMVEAVAAAIKRHVEVKNELGVTVKGEENLKECAICLCCLKLKVHVPIEVVRRHMFDGEDEKFLSANAACWQVTE